MAVAAVVSLVGVAESFESSFLALYTRRGADLVVQRRGGTVQLSKGVPLSLGERIRRLPGAGQVIGGLMDMVAFEDRDLFMVIVNGWEPDCPVLDRVKITAGRRLRAGDKNCVMLGRILAANLGKQPGDRGRGLLAALPRGRRVRELQRLRERGGLHAPRRSAAANGPPGPGDRLHRPVQSAGRPGGDGRAGPAN